MAIVRALFVVIVLAACIYMREAARRGDFYFCYSFTKDPGWKRPSPAHERRPYYSAHNWRDIRDACEECEKWCWHRYHDSCDEIEQNERHSIPQEIRSQKRWDIPPPPSSRVVIVGSRCIVWSRGVAGLAAAWLHWWALVRTAFGDGYCVTRRRYGKSGYYDGRDEVRKYGYSTHLAELICTTTYAPPRAVALRS